ncbi:MAG: alcohol dehydrogenase catalytic domain-containing protein [Actinomycetota bacterium]
MSDRVAGTFRGACGLCRRCIEGRYNLCEDYGPPGLHRQYGHTAQGACAGFVVQGVKAVFYLPDRPGLHEGALLGPASTAWHTANRGGVQPGDTVAVMGPGPQLPGALPQHRVGLQFPQGAQHLGRLGAAPETACHHAVGPAWGSRSRVCTDMAANRAIAAAIAPAVTYTIVSGRAAAPSP